MRSIARVVNGRRVSDGAGVDSVESLESLAQTIWIRF